MSTSRSNGWPEKIGPIFHEEQPSIPKAEAIKNHGSSACSHFSIRGYVKEIYRLDQKLCWPFVVYDDEDKLADETKKAPPLSVPQFRWWCCIKCLGLGNSYLADSKVHLAANSRFKLKAGGMHIELGGENVSLNGTNSSRSANRKYGFPFLLPSGETIAAKHFVSLPVVPSDLGDLPSEHEHLLNGHVNTNVSNPSGMIDEHIACLVDVQTCLKRENATKMVDIEFSNGKSNCLYLGSTLGAEITNGQSQFGRGVFCPITVQESDSSESGSREARKGVLRENVALGEERKKSVFMKITDSSESGFREGRKGVLRENAALGEEREKSGLMKVTVGDATGDLHCMDIGLDDYDSCGRDSHPKEIKNNNLLSPAEMFQNQIPRGLDIDDPFPIDGTSPSLAIQKTRLLSEVIKECEMLEGAEKSKVIRETYQCEGGSPFVTSPIASISIQITQRRDCKRKKKKELPCKHCESTNIIYSQGSSSSLTKREKRSSLQNFEVCKTSEASIFEIPEEQRVQVQTFTDEIPMDIVELMAKNQHDRQLFSSEDKRLNQPLNACSRWNANMRDITSFLHNDVSDLLPDDVPFSRNDQLTDERNKRSAVAWGFGPENDVMDLLPIISGTDDSNAYGKDTTIDFWGRLQFPILCHDNKHNAQHSDRSKDSAGCRLSTSCVQPTEAYSANVDILKQSLSSLHMFPSPRCIQGTYFGSCLDRSVHPDSIANLKKNGTKIEHGNLVGETFKEPVTPHPHNSEGGNESYLEKHLYTSETISAMNLLRLMNKGALFCTSGNFSENQSPLCCQTRFSSDDHHKASVNSVDCLNNPLISFLQPVPHECDDLYGSARSTICQLGCPVSRTSCARCSMKKEGYVDAVRSKMSFDSLFHSSCLSSSCMMHKMVPGYHNVRHNRQEQIGRFAECMVELPYVDKTFQCGSELLSLSRPPHKRIQSVTCPPIRIHDEKNEGASPIESGHVTEMCILNRNPAEISMPEDELGFMIQIDSPKRRSHPLGDRRGKRRKAMKLTALMANS